MEPARTVVAQLRAEVERVADQLAGTLAHAGIAVFDVDSVLLSDAESDSWRSPSERGAALELLLAADRCLPAAAPVADVLWWRDGLDLLKAGDVDAAVVLVGKLNDALATAGTDERPDDDVVHGVNILQGSIHLQRAELDEAEACLRAAGNVDAAALPGFFGPNLTLAWGLLAAGRDDAVCAYFHDLSRTWIPPY